MLGEALVAAAVGIAAVWLVLQPLTRRPSPNTWRFEPLDPEETPKGIALAALKEIEFDRQTGKLSDADYELLKGRYTAAALDALREDQPEVVSDDIEAMIAAKVRALRSASASAPSDTGSSAPRSGPACGSCGPRPEPDALFCSTCGCRLPTNAACDRCGAALLPDSRFCEACGRQVAA
jgi:rRNA maturation endonuclease Nob1